MLKETLRYQYLGYQDFVRNLYFWLRFIFVLAVCLRLLTHFNNRQTSDDSIYIGEGYWSHNMCAEGDFYTFLFFRVLPQIYFQK